VGIRPGLLLLLPVPPSGDRLVLADVAYNETHFNDPHYTQLYKQASATTQQSGLTPIEQDMMSIDYNSGGYIIPYFVPVLDAHPTNLQGMEPAVTGAALPIGR
jgi:peptide/nickel transport system substrate-binding protein